MLLVFNVCIREKCDMRSVAPCVNRTNSAKQSKSAGLRLCKNGCLSIRLLFWRNAAWFVPKVLMKCLEDQTCCAWCKELCLRTALKSAKSTAFMSVILQKLLGMPNPCQAYAIKPKNEHEGNVLDCNRGSNVRKNDDDIFTRILLQYNLKKTFGNYLSSN